MKFLYVEEPLLDHPRTREIQDKIDATLIPIRRYGEVFIPIIKNNLQN